MSTGLECQIVETKTGQWYYILENYGASKNAWDWREDATCYGPFVSEDAATKSLSDNHANPGGYSVGPANEDSDPVMQALLKDAGKPARRSGSFGRRYW